MRSIDTMGGAWDASVEIDSIISTLKGTFHEWIDSLNQAFADNKIEIESEDAFFISFNYTLALENLYNIYSSRILHIHGCLNDDEYIIGYGRAYDEVKEEAEPYIPLFNPNEDEPSEYGLNVYDDEITENTKDEVVSQIMAVAKPTGEIINKYGNIFDKLGDVCKVCIYGLSFSSVDEPYLNRIISSVSPRAVFVVSYYSDSN